MSLVRAAVALVWVSAVAALLVWRPEPLVVLLMLQAAVCLSCLLLLLFGSHEDVATPVERGLVRTATAMWQVVDQAVIDGTIDGIGRVVAAGGTWLRRAQSGSVRVHAAAALGGALAMIGYLLWH